MLFVLLIFRDILKKQITRFFTWLAGGAYNQLAGYKPFWWIALRRYRRSLVREHQELKIPFRRGRPLQMGEIYVPLKVSGSSGRDLVDAHTALGERIEIRRFYLTSEAAQVCPTQVVGNDEENVGALVGSFILRSAPDSPYQRQNRYE